MKGHSLAVSEVYKYNFVNVRYGKGMEEGDVPANSFAKVCATPEGERRVKG